LHFIISRRYGFNGKEKDDEGMGGGGSTYDHGFRIYNASLGKFLSVDPLSKSYPWYTPYQYAGNKPIIAIDLDGAEETIVIRWYDVQNNWVETEVINNRDVNDRPLGVNTVFYLNLQQGNIVDANISTQLKSLSSLAAQSSSQSASRQVLSRLLNSTNNLTDNNGNLIFGRAFIRPCIGNEQEYSVLQTSIDEINNVQKEYNDLMGGPSNLGIRSKINTLLNAKSWGEFGVEDNVIFFDYGSSLFNADLDNDENGSSNVDELLNAISKLSTNPDRIGTITGNASSEDDIGVNQNLSNQRAMTVATLLINGGVAQGQIVNQGGQSAQNAQAGTSKNDRTKQSINRNAKITYTYPIQNQ
jgi:RHS repeat-associated protein